MKLAFDNDPALSIILLALHLVNVILASETSSVNVTNDADMQGSSNSASIRIKEGRGRKAKYPALYNMMLDAPTSSKIKYKTEDGALIAQFEHEAIPIIAEEMSLVSGSSSNDATSLVPQKTKVNRYAIKKAEAEAEGRLEEFMQMVRDRGARQRQRAKENNSKGVNKYQHACRKLNIEALRLKDPDEAQQKEEKRRAQNRESSKRFYERHLAAERLRRRKKKGMDRAAEKQALQEEDYETITSKVVHDFDLNDSASEKEFDLDDTCEIAVEEAPPSSLAR